MSMTNALGLFVAVLTYGSFLLAIATIIWLGVKGKPAWSAPICARCKYDLRGRDPARVTNCPECGADLLGPKAVLFMKGAGRRWGLITWGAVLLLMPVAGAGVIAGISYYQYTVQSGVGSSGAGYVPPHQLSSMSTAQLLQSQLPGRIDEPWVWNVLEDRVKAGQLSQQEAEDAVQQLTQYMKLKKPNGWDAPLSWQSIFMTAASGAGLLSDTVLFDFCDGYYGPAPTIEPLGRLRARRDAGSIRINFGTVWETQHGLDWRLVWDVKRMLVDGRSVAIHRPHRYRGGWYGTFDTVHLAEGEHEVEVELDCVFVPEANLMSVDATAIPVENVPNPKRRWSVSAKQTFSVYPQDVDLVKLIEDPARNPMMVGSLAIERIVVEPVYGGGRKRLNLTLDADGLGIPCSFDVAITSGDHRVEVGSWSYRGPDMNNGKLSQNLADLDPAITSARVIFTPNAKHIERWPEVTEIWGKPIVFENVPIDRLDLPAGGETP